MHLSSQRCHCDILAFLHPKEPIEYFKNHDWKIDVSERQKMLHHLQGSHPVTVDHSLLYIVMQ